MQIDSVWIDELAEKDAVIYRISSMTGWNTAYEVAQAKIMGVCVVELHSTAKAKAWVDVNSRLQYTAMKDVSLPTTHVTSKDQECTYPFGLIKKPTQAKDQYHHYIPRFILRYFQNGSGRIMTCRERTMAFRDAKKTGIDLESIFFYDVDSKTLQMRPLGKVYGSMNLYRDTGNPLNIDHLEEKFSYLENNASGIIRGIHAALGVSLFTTTRKELASLRKFIFLMHYRNEAVSSRYFQEDHPENAPLVDWIRKLKQTKGLSSDVDVWRHGLEYYLNTPHHVIVAAAERVREKHGNDKLHEMLRNRVDPDIEDWYAIDYETLANYFFLGVWEAADGCEFVLGGNGFGLWEVGSEVKWLRTTDSLTSHVKSVTRQFVGGLAISRLTPIVTDSRQRPMSSVLLPLRPQTFCLANIPIVAADIQYADDTIFEGEHSHDPNASKRAYRSSSKAQDDRFTLRITKLTPSETYAVNEVTMLNVNLCRPGSLSFSSPTAMLDTPLFLELMKLERNSSVKPVNLTTTIPALEVESDADVQLNMLLRFILMKAVDFPSNYNRAYLVFQMATAGVSLRNVVSSSIRKILVEATTKLKQVLDPPLLPNPQKRDTRVLEKLPRQESELFFALVGYQVDLLNVGRHTNDLLGNIIYEAAIVGVLWWLAENRHDVLVDLHPWGLSDWLDERHEKDEVVRQITATISQIHHVIAPLRSLEKSAKVEMQLLDCLKRLGEIMRSTREHLLLWDQNRSSRLIGFFSPGTVTKQLKEDEQRLNQQLILLLVAITLADHLKGVHRHREEPRPPLVQQSTSASKQEVETDVRVFWRRCIGDRHKLTSAHNFFQQLATWTGRFIGDLQAQRLLLWLDEAGSGTISLSYLEELVGKRNFRDAVTVFSEDPHIPLLISIGDNPTHYSQHVAYALEAGVTVVQLTSSAQAIAWIRINATFLRNCDHPASIRFIADNVRVKVDPVTGTPLLNYSAGQNMLRHIRNNNITAPVLIRANSTIQTTHFVADVKMAGSTARPEALFGKEKAEPLYRELKREGGIPKSECQLFDASVLRGTQPKFPYARCPASRRRKKSTWFYEGMEEKCLYIPDRAPFGRFDFGITFILRSTGI
ncbi:hypothetical protein B0H34DRAFT_806871 [Crassisporium funariophilum]|nr:hypothetical protein B0H34DRAFT_806871 [Crassisporium funariophilum]